jgi:hypothetical protein
MTPKMNKAMLALASAVMQDLEGREDTKGQLVNKLIPNVMKAMDELLLVAAEEPIV